MGIFYRVGRLIYRLRWLVVLLWVVALGVSAYFAPQVGDRLTGGDITLPGSESAAAQEILDEQGSGSGDYVIVFQSESLDAKGDDFRQAESEILDRVRDLPGVSEVTGYESTGEDSFVSDGGESYAVIGTGGSAGNNLLENIRSETGSGELETYVTGQDAVESDLQEAAQESIEQAEIFALPIALVILVVAFGGLVAAGIPMLVGVTSVLGTLGLVFLASQFYEMSIFVTQVATMLGLGLGIDYALMVVSRFREELEEHPAPEAVARTVGTAGRTIFFSGTAVLIGLAGLFFFPLPTLRSVGIGGVLVVSTTVLAALTLAPVVMGLLGGWINRLSVRRRRSRNAASGAGNVWQRIGGLGMRRPVFTILAVAVVAGALIYPLSNLQTGLANAQALPDEVESRAGDDLLREEFQYASLSPIQLVARTGGDPTNAENLAKIQTLGQEAADTQGVDGVTSVYTVGEQAAQQYAEGIQEARQQAEEEAASQTDQVVDEQFEEQIETQTDKAIEEQLAALREQRGTVPEGSEERIRSEVEPQVRQSLEEAGAREKIRTEVEKKAQERIDEQVPTIPDGVSANGEITPQGVASFLDTDAARDNGQLQDALDTFVADEAAVVQAVPDSDPYSEESRQTVQNLRGLQDPEGLDVSVGGLSAQQRDVLTELFGPPLVYAGLFVIGATYLTLAASFRSLVAPLKGLLVNGLSLAASMGVLVFIFQQGHLSEALNFTDTGFVDALVPILTFCVVFGISMDYEVFLLSRIKEARDAGETPEKSIDIGLSSIGGIIASAAAILMTVTGAFAFADILQIKALGIGIAVAVFIAAFLMQMLFVPAVMKLLGEWAWWPSGSRKKKKEKKKG
ncbi:MMPL family transporter [Rubrobacter aplysinae]|uniref:MMPL family transporter n=1 Tax=Rubrobacter aplysinae TaxID=909625 RepID=UPI00069CFC78|nr:MMPL family transporter [Rubrobacter aplysinae]